MRQIICLSLFLVSCKGGFPTIAPQERCFTLFDKSLIVDDEQYLSGVCRCAMYEWTGSHIGRITEATSKPLVYCDKHAGFNPESTGAIYNLQESIRLWLNRRQ